METRTGGGVHHLPVIWASCKQGFLGCSRLYRDAWVHGEEDKGGILTHAHSGLPGGVDIDTIAGTRWHGLTTRNVNTLASVHIPHHSLTLFILFRP